MIVTLKDICWVIFFPGPWQDLICFQTATLFRKRRQLPPRCLKTSSLSAGRREASPVRYLSKAETWGAAIFTCFRLGKTCSCLNKICFHQVQVEPDGSVELDSIQSQFPGITGIKYRNPATQVTTDNIPVGKYNLKHNIVLDLEISETSRRQGTCAT